MKWPKSEENIEFGVGWFWWSENLASQLRGVAPDFVKGSRPLLEPGASMTGGRGALTPALFYDRGVDAKNFRFFEYIFFLMLRSLMSSK